MNCADNWLALIYSELSIKNWIIIGSIIIAVIVVILTTTTTLLCQKYCGSSKSKSAAEMPILGDYEGENDKFIDIEAYS